MNDWGSAAAIDASFIDSMKACSVLRVLNRIFNKFQTLNYQFDWLSPGVH